MTPTLLHDLLDDRAARTPDAIAITRNGVSVSFAQLREVTITAADWLRGRAGHGDRVVILDRNRPETVALLFAASRLGSIYVVVNEQIPAYQLGHILADCTPSLIVGHRAAVSSAAAMTDIPVAAIEDLPVAAVAGPLPAAPCLSTDVASLIYTSGSTAMPKAVVSTHRQVLFATAAIDSQLGYRTDDAVLCCLPLSFDYGLYQVFLACQSGARLVLADERDAGPGLLGRLIDDRITVFPLLPHLAVTLCRLVERSGRRPHELRMITNTGAALPATVAARLRDAIPGVAVVAMFGLTECKRVTIAEPDIDLTRPGTAGQALPDTEIYVAGPDGARLPAGEVGELVVRGPHVMAGYWNAPELTAKRFRRDYLGRSWLHTGDRCRVDEDGYLYYVGRADDVYKQNGYRVSAVEVEAAAMSIPGVELAAVLTPDNDHGARLAVTGAATRRQLVTQLLARLGHQKIPGDCQVVDEMPVTANRKIDKRALHRQWKNKANEAA